MYCCEPIAYDPEGKKVNESVRPVFNYLVELTRPVIEEIKQPGGLILSDPLVILDYQMSQLEQHHSLNTQTNCTNRKQYLIQPTTIHEMSALQQIPIHLRDAFAKSFTKHSNTSLASTMTAALNAPIAFDMFKDAIINKATGTSAGLFGLTINMLRSAQEPLLFELYNHINFF